MDLLFIVGTFTKIINAIQGICRWVAFWRREKINIAQPFEGQTANTRMIAVVGTHNRAAGHYWLFTRSGNKYWPQSKVEMQPNGQWKGIVNVGPMPGPRACIYILVKVPRVIDDLLIDIQKRSGKLKNWDPVIMESPPKKLFSVIHERTLQVPQQLPP